MVARPAFEKFVEGFRSAPALFRLWTLEQEMEAAFIQVEDNRISWGYVSIGARDKGSSVESVVTIRQSCPPTCNRPFFFLGSNYSWNYERVNRARLAQLSPIEFVKTTVTAVARNDPTVGGPISIAAISTNSGIRFIDRGVCYAESASPIKDGRPRKRQQ